VSWNFNFYIFKYFPQAGVLHFIFRCPFSVRLLLLTAQYCITAPPQAVGSLCWQVLQVYGFITSAGTNNIGGMAKSLACIFIFEFYLVL
jgi:hypothetical protein